MQFGRKPLSARQTGHLASIALRTELAVLSALAADPGRVQHLMGAAVRTGWFVGAGIVSPIEAGATLRAWVGKAWALSGEELDEATRIIGEGLLHGARQIDASAGRAT